MTSRWDFPKGENAAEALRDATDLRILPGESPHALHAEPGISGGAPHRSRRPRPAARHRDEGEQTRLARLYARQLTLRLLKDQSPSMEGANE